MENPSERLARNIEASASCATAPELRAELVLAYLPLVHQIARAIQRTLPRSVLLEDLVSSGVIGLVHATRHFDNTRHVEFGSYARYRIRGAIMDSLRQADWASRSLRRQCRRLEEARNRLSVRLGRPPTESEIAAELKITLDDYHALSRDIAGLNVSSLDSHLSDPQKPESLLDRIAVTCRQDIPYENCVQSELRALLHHLITELREPERRVIVLYYFNDLTMNEVGSVLGLSESRVSQIHSKAVALLRAGWEQVNGQHAKSEQSWLDRRKEYAELPAHRKH